LYGCALTEKQKALNNNAMDVAYAADFLNIPIPFPDFLRPQR
jgi:hypothetical protein